MSPSPTSATTTASPCATASRYRNVPADVGTAQATLTLSGKMRLLAAAAGDLTSPGLDITGGGRRAPGQLVEVLDQPDPAFNIVTP